jgi:glycosyltransferase involved in cell wall biosynthesis
MGGLPPVVVTFHGSDLLGENLSGPWRKLISRYGVYCSRRAARKAHGVVVVARHLLDALRGAVSLEQVKVIPCGIDLERFRRMDPIVCRQRLGWPAGISHVLFATSAGDPVKRPWLARAAMEHLAADGIRAELHLLSGIPNSDVPVWINASDVLLLTSKHEGSPTIVKEALACGVPIVSVDVGDVGERIDGIKGCYLASAEPADLALRLRWVFERSRRLDCRGRLEELSCEVTAGKLKEFYGEILGRGTNHVAKENRKGARFLPIPTAWN